MIVPYKGLVPDIHESAFVEITAVVAGDVVIGANSSVWFHTVVRGDENYIRIGERTNIQDLSVVHITHETAPTVIGSEVTIGHSAVVHGCTIGDHTLIGMGSVVLDKAEIGDNCLVGAGSVVPPGMKVPNNSLVMGVPAKVVREVRESDIKLINDSLYQYLGLMKDYGDRNSERP